MQSTTTNFLVLADPQFGIASFLLNKHSGRTTPNAIGETLAPPGTPASGWPYEASRLQRAVEIANEMKPDFVIVLGDMVMHWDNDGQQRDVSTALESLDPNIPVRWVPGNHDVGVDFFSPTDESLERYRKNFGPDYYSFNSGPTRFIGFNSALLDHPERAPKEAEAQMAWLEHELSGDTSNGVQQTIAFAHHPPFLRERDEEYGTYNLPEPNRTRLLELLAGNGVTHLFTGHTHANVLTRLCDLKIIATSSIGVSRHGHASGYRIVNVTPDGVSHSFHALA